MNVHLLKTRFFLVTTTFFGVNMDYPEGPTYEAAIDSSQYDSRLLGENDLGSVYIHGPFGNENSGVKKLLMCKFGRYSIHTVPSLY